jgi:hypothetical protein
LVFGTTNCQLPNICRVSKKDDNGKYAYYGNDKDEGVELLEKYLRDLKQDGNNNKYSVHLVAAKKGFAPCITFQFNDDAPAAVSSYRPDNEILSRLAAIENAIQTQPDEDEDEDEPENNNILAGILNDPTMKNLLIGLIANVAGSMMPKPQAVAGITDNETETEILQTIQKLFEKGVTVDDLKRLAAMDQGQITFLLSMLRK